ncbi:MAG TPA: HEAT repeat domain-containing protein [Bryobacteraceae bacterium]|nr:HEAT repeat domain-containing protein [Bryobacteraceae bacterium]
MLWLLAVPLAAHAQPKLLVNARLDTRTAATGLEREFRALLSTQPEPAWIAYAVPYNRSFNLGCEYVSPEGSTVPGVVHLEPPAEAIILFRVVGGAVDRVRVLSPDCEIDAGGVPFHWLTGVKPAGSVALLEAVSRQETIRAIALHADPSADAALERMLAAGEPEAVRRNAAFWLGAARGQRGLETLQRLLATEPDRTVRERAIAGLAVSHQPKALDLLISIARREGDPRTRRAAMNAIGRSADPRAQAFLEEILKR